VEVVMMGEENIWMIVGAYAVSVLANRTMNMLDWVQENKEFGFKGYWKKYWPKNLKNMLMHVPVGAMWCMGILLPVVNGVLGGAGVSKIESVTSMSSLAAGWIADSVSSRISKRIPGGNGGTK
jgi:hypothetical protein